MTSTYGAASKTLSETQKKAVDWLADQSRGLLVAPTGVGKTAIGLHTLARVLPDNRQALVVVPAKVLSGWVREAADWPALAGLTVAPFGEGAQVELISFNALDRALKQATYVHHAVIIDEITKCRSASGRWALAIRALSRHSAHVYGMTATPVNESLDGLYGMMKTLDGGERLGKRQDVFKRTYFRQLDYQGYRWELIPEKLSALLGAVSDVLYQIDDGEKTAALPSLTHCTETLPLPDSVRTTVDALTKNYSVTVHSENAEGAAEQAAEGLRVVASNAGVMISKVRQLTCGFVLSEDGVPTWLTSFRVKAVSEYVKRHNALVVVENVCAAIALAQATQGLVLNGATSAREVDRILALGRSGALRESVLIMHPLAGGHGVDGLQYSFDHVVFFAPLWSLDQTEQCIGRVWRQGQTRPVTVTTFHVADSIDQHVADGLTRKLSTVDVFNEWCAERKRCTA